MVSEERPPAVKITQAEVDNALLRADPTAAIPFIKLEKAGSFYKPFPSFQFSSHASSLEELTQSVFNHLRESPPGMCLLAEAEENSNEDTPVLVFIKMSGGYLCGTILAHGREGPPMLSGNLDLLGVSNEYGMLSCIKKNLRQTGR